MKWSVFFIFLSILMFISWIITTVLYIERGNCLEDDECVAKYRIDLAKNREAYEKSKKDDGSIGSVHILPNGRGGFHYFYW